MIKIVKVREVTLGEGKPKVCVPLVGITKEEILLEARELINTKLDIVEWRIDFYDKLEEISNLLDLLKELRNILNEIPLLVTFRSKKEGGQLEITNDYYIKMNKAVIESGNADLVDVELFIGDEIVKEIVECAHRNNVKVIMSNHDFNKTPSKDEIINRLCKMQELNADLPKIAVMPKNTTDVLTLLSATNEMNIKYANRPIITMSMGALGLLSRLSGEVFGSSVTFGAAKVASAPGQIDVVELNNVLEIIHNNSILYK